MFPDVLNQKFSGGVGVPTQNPEALMLQDLSVGIR
jgi:hypothetical protein